MTAARIEAARVRPLAAQPERTALGRAETAPQRTKRTSRRRSPLVAISAGGALIATLGLGYVGLQAEELRLTRRLGQVQSQLHELELEHAQLTAAVQQKSALERIERLARERLAMVDEAPHLVLVDPEPPAAGPGPVRDRRGADLSLVGLLWQWFVARIPILR